MADRARFRAELVLNLLLALKVSARGGKKIAQRLKNRQRFGIAISKDISLACEFEAPRRAVVRHHVVIMLGGSGLGGLYWSNAATCRLFVSSLYQDVGLPLF